MIRILSCIVVLALCLFAFINKQNEITKLRLQIPALVAELEAINQENIRLQFEIDQLESPSRLLELASRPEYRHLKHPTQDEVIEITR